MRDPGAILRISALTMVAGLGVAACTSAPSAPARSRSSAAQVVAHPLPTELQQQSERFMHPRSAANPTAVTILTSSRNLTSGQHGVVLTVRSVGNLLASCSSSRPEAKFVLTYRGAGPPTVTEARVAMARPTALHLLAPYWPPAPSLAGAKQQFVFFQAAAGGEAADFSLALWATLTPVPGGCAFSTNAVLRVRCTAYANQICSYIASQKAWARMG